MHDVTREMKICRLPQGYRRAGQLGRVLKPRRPGDRIFQVGRFGSRRLSTLVYGKMLYSRMASEATAICGTRLVGRPQRVHLSWEISGQD